MAVARSSTGDAAPTLWNGLQCLPCGIVISHRKASNESCPKGARPLLLLRTLCRPTKNAQRKSRPDGGRCCRGGSDRRLQVLNSYLLRLGSGDKQSSVRCISKSRACSKSQVCSDARTRRLNDLQNFCNKALQNLCNVSIIAYAASKKTLRLTPGCPERCRTSLRQPGVFLFRGSSNVSRSL